MKLNSEDLQNLVHYIKVPIITGNSRYILDRFIRKIHARMEFNITETVETKLKELNLFKTQSLTKSQMTTTNRKLKKIGFNDSVTIEHLYSVKKMVDDLILMRDTFDGVTDENVVYEYFISKTHCVYKFHTAERDLQG